ncbi:MAG: M48 family metalloprotease [Candidatus Hydrogenedens sp.]|nr:M48 family metalloprotease [Candidatus Hydrogenedens sp.]
MRLLILSLVFALGAVWAHAQDAPAPQAAAAASTDSAGPVPVPEPSELAVQRYRSGNVLWVVNQLWGLLIPALFLFTGFSARIRGWATRIGRWWFFVIVVYLALFMVINYLIDFPLAFYQGYIREHAYGLSNQTFQKWFQDSLISLAVAIVMGSLFLWVPYLLLKKAPQRWWLYTGLLVPPFLFFQMLVTPVFIDPLFNDFGPMQDKALESRILSLADRAGIEGSRVYEVKKSEDTKAVNAYVTGFMNTKRIVLWDTLLDKLDDEEVLFVMGHEMGHYVLKHVVYSIFFISVIIMAALYAVHRLSRGILARYGGRFGFDRLDDIASLPLIILLMSVISLVVTPIILAHSRYHEHEADRFGLELLKDNHAAATSFVKLQQENLAVPWPNLLYKLWRGTHPSIGERITFFNEYTPWESGEPMQYEHLFEKSAAD